MKKLLGTILAVAMLASMSTVAFAETTEITTNNGTDSADVTAKYVAGSDCTTVYSVDVAWDSMEFTYTASSQGLWNPEKHMYENPTESKWEGEGTITVTNHSNALLWASFEYEKAKDESAQGLFEFTGNTETSNSGSKTFIKLYSAVGTNVNSAPTGSAELKLSGDFSGSDTEFTKIGSVTVTIEKGDY